RPPRRRRGGSDECPRGRTARRGEPPRPDSPGVTLAARALYIKQQELEVAALGERGEHRVVGRGAGGAAQPQRGGRGELGELFEQVGLGDVARARGEGEAAGRLGDGERRGGEPAVRGERSGPGPLAGREARRIGDHEVPAAALAGGAGQKVEGV